MMRHKNKSSLHYVLVALLCFHVFACNRAAKNALPATLGKPKLNFDTSVKTIHVFVALCDNKYQGIVPVPPKIGNGQDPDNNLYWGNSYGVRTYFNRSKDWQLLSARQMKSPLIQRLVFKHNSSNYYLIADGYDGRYIQQATKDFLQSTAGLLTDTVHSEGKTIGINGNSTLLAYVGHDGLMDFWFNKAFRNIDGKKRKCIILACYSKRYFEPFVKAANADPLVWTTGLMCPEAYTLHDAVSAFINNDANEDIRSQAAVAYDRYQKCGVSFARKLLVTGWEK